MFPLSILLIDDHAMFRSGMAMVLRSGIANIDVFEAASLEEAMRSPIEAPAILLLDIQLQGLNGLECIAVLQRKWPQVSIIMLSADATPTTVRLALERGAVAFVSKADTATNILAIIEQVLRKEPTAGISGNTPPEPHLTPRQCEVLDLLCQGLPNKTIGKRLGLSENTVRGHVQALLSFLQVSSRSEAAFAARRSGLVS
ncbi:response regulator [Collimonas antrihumi]|uniref:response regulator n=1 Tax=Collimonas antrihumi TaxID=1940615 RepID=UPI001B8D1F34|nr:response regulator transcription factor [Collimonas antrihumi]